MGLRLKSQMASFLFLLFGSTILLVTYFNVTVLAQTLQRQAEQEALGDAAEVASGIRELGPEGAFDVGLFRQPREARKLDRYLSHVARFRGLQFYDAGFREVYSFKVAPQPSRSLGALARRAAVEGRPVWTLWSYLPGGPSEGQPFKGLTPFSRGLVSLEYFQPLRYRNASGGEFGEVLGVLHLSLRTSPVVRRLQFMVVGNAILAILFLITSFIAINLWGEHAVNRPLRNLVAAQELLGRGDYTAHVDLAMPSANEMIVLTNSFNRMASELQQYQGALEEKTRRLEEVNLQYRRLNEGLEQQVEEKTRELREYFSLLTHDLRIPLAAIQGYADLLGRGELNARQARSLKGIATANGHLLELVRNLLDAVRFDAGPVAMIPEPFALEDLVREVLAHLGPSAEGEAARVHLDLDLAEGRVYADRTRIGRVLTNLLGNALELSPEGPPVLLRAVEVTGQVEIEVSDHGPGIPPENLPHLFQKFRHFPSRQGPSTGLGLGLYIVRRILEGHGRTISVESAPGQGTRFFFSLPVPPELRAEGDQGARP